MNAPPKRLQFIRWQDRASFVEILYRRLRFTQSLDLDPYRQELRDIVERYTEDLEDAVSPADELIVRFKSTCGGLLFRTARRLPNARLEDLRDIIVEHHSPPSR